MGSTTAWDVYWGPQDEKASIEAIHAAIDAGINWIDTAPFYGWGRAETVVGKALKGKRDKVYVFTKCGVYQGTGSGEVIDLRPESIRREVEDSLTRLQTDVIDLYQFHTPDSKVPEAESWGAMQDLVSEGKVRFGGLSNFSNARMVAALTVGPVTATQNQYSILAREVEATTLPYALEHGIGFLAWSPLASGFLVDGFDLGGLAESDFRRTRALSREPGASHLRNLRSVLAEVATGEGCSMAELALAWVLDHPGVTGAIVGMQRVEEVASAARASEIRLSDSARSAIRAAVTAFPAPPPTD